jgi:hypothetical protein
VIRVLKFYNQLLPSIEIGTQESVQQMAQYEEATLVRQGPARNALVGTMSQRMADKIQSCRQFIRGEQANLGTQRPVAPIAPLTLLFADTGGNVAPAGRKKKKASKIKSTRNILVEEVRRSARTEYDRRCPGSCHQQQQTSGAGKRTDAPGSSIRHIHGRGGGR